MKRPLIDTARARSLLPPVHSHANILAFAVEQVGAAERISMDALRLSIEHERFPLECAVVRVTRKVATLSGLPGQVLKVPATWWDALKLRFFPAWVLKRWPAVMRTYHAKHFFPDVPIPDHCRRVEVAVWDEGRLGVL